MTDTQNNVSTEQEYYGSSDKLVGITKYTNLPDDRLRVSVDLFGSTVGSMEIVEHELSVRLTADKPSQHVRQILAKFNIYTEFSFVLKTADHKTIVCMLGNTARFAHGIAIPIEMGIDIIEKVLDFCDWKITMEIIRPPRREDMPAFRLDRPARAPAKRQKTAPADGHIPQ